MKAWKLLLAIIFILLVVLFLYLQNNSIDVTSIELKNDRLPKNFNGFKIVHISDLHGKFFGANQQNLAKVISELDPDIVVFTGDLVDSKHNDEDAGVILLGQAAKVAPVFFVTGNHEWETGSFDTLQQKLVSAGVNVLRDASMPLKRKDEALFILGIDDMTKASEASARSRYNTLRTSLDSALASLSGDDFKILLAHRPEVVSVYREYGVDLVLSGHTHGGQVRLPFIGGILAPDQGLFPKYIAGIYKVGDTTMVISRGLGSTIIPLRVFNRPEVVLITLRR